ncbi:hypothetical protein QTP88_020081 [Uroleucon formosanum]
MVAKNCLKQINKDFDLIHLKSIIEENVYLNVYKLLQVALILTISSATCERSFSALRKIKSLLRVSMGQDRLTDLSILYIEKDLTKLINVNKVIDSFAEKDRRINLV